MYIFLVFHRYRVEKVCICKLLIEVGGSQSHIQDSVDKTIGNVQDMAMN